ncbi:DEAD/DEAH box helicase [Streptomyces sp. NPDC127113]|uniref:DEAD/DEAH box helicase n=1 Tax=Streptomyces sp. NPDC127113 TaxID=3345365 RepID=UPI00363CDAE2
MHIYAPAVGLAVPLGNGLLLDVDDAVLEDAAKYTGPADTGNIGSVMAFLARELLLEPRPGAPADARRMVVSAGPTGSFEAGFRVHGPGLMADVEKHSGGYRIVRLLRAVHDQHSTVQKALAVGSIDFRDMTARQRDRERIQQGLDLVASQDGYLAMWDRYQELEARHIRRRLRDFGTIRYTDVKVEPDGRCAFTVDLRRALPRTRAALENTAAVERVEIEAAPEVPTSVTDTAMSDREWLVASRAQKVRAWVGEPLGYDSVTEVLRLTATLNNQQDPPPQGWLYLAHRGDQRRLDRREKAMQQLRTHGTHIPALPTLLEGGVWPQSAPRRITKLLPSALNCFAPHGPTPAQREAVLAALNTPDIAIIQGPPGTGKTQVIAALVNQLGDLAQGGAIAGSTLLTSFQHAAVDHLVTRGWVFGLPPLKVDSRGRGSKVALDTWRIEAARAADLRLRERPAGPHLAARRAAAELAATYRAAPVPPEFLPHFLDQVIIQLEHVAERTLVAELRGHRDRAEQQRVRAAAMADPDVRADLLPYIRSLRCTATGFDDDGPRTARALLVRLEIADSPLFDGISYREPLRAAVNATAPQTALLDALTTLRDTLIDRLTARIRLPEVTVADPAIVDLLDRIAARLAEAVTRSPDAIAAALLDYRDDLRSDPEGVDDTLRAYTVSLASTCQQAVSKAMVESGGRQDGVFESVVVDEAARANPLDLLIPLAQARRRIVLVGDHAQLPHMLEPDVERELGSLGDDVRDRLQESLFQRLGRRWEHGSPDGHTRFVRLDTQFRMHPVLGTFVSDNFYEGKLRNGREAGDFIHGIDRYGEVPAVWLSVPQSAGGESRRGTSRARPAEAAVIAAEIAALIERHPSTTFGVISFYAAQVTEVWKELKKVGLAEFTEAGGWRPVPRLSRDEDGTPLDRLRVGTVDAFQGMEFSVTYLSTVRSCVPDARTETKRAYGHLTVANRLCVAMSRQQRLLVVVGDDDMFGPVGPDAVKPLAAFLELCRKETSGRVVRP